MNNFGAIYNYELDNTAQTGASGSAGIIPDGGAGGAGYSTRLSL
jgi:hypothetical protein